MELTENDRQDAANYLSIMLDFIGGGFGESEKTHVQELIDKLRGGKEE